MRLRFAPVALGLLAALGAAAATTNELSDAEIQGRQLAQQLLLEQRPATNFTQTGFLRLRDAKGRRTEIPIRFQIFPTESNSSNWLSDYETTATNNPVKLVIVHAAGQPNGYRLFAGGMQNDLDGPKAMIPFAGSDFWAADLGLEFFHWPQQKVLKMEVKRSRGCTVLESTNPSTNGYWRVVSWIDSESGGIVQAWAYDTNNKLLKEFYPKDFKKMNGQWQVGEMEIDNDQTGSRTRLEFNLKKE
ncbi:MAG: outer membrane lipoprotein-sorting protein [Verrucomicrobiia bacterium]